jgi:hypothetical protein
MVIRDVNITTVAKEDFSDAWRAICGVRELHHGTFAEFGFAEEVIGIIHYKSGLIEVGIGQMDRPFEMLYAGVNDTKAEDLFWDTIEQHARLGS